MACIIDIFLIIKYIIINNLVSCSVLDIPTKIQSHKTRIALYD